MITKWIGLAALLIAASACSLPTSGTLPTGAAQSSRQMQPVAPLSGRTAVRNFIEVLQAVEPVAERICRARTVPLNCDFQIVVDARPDVGPNAFQTVSDSGQPVIAFTVPLIGQARNKDELAFVMAHEAAHHIQEHINRQNQIAIAGAELFGQLAAIASGGQAASIRRGQEIGAQVGSRAYSKDFELEADALGSVIAYQAGFDPLLGAQFFLRIPDPGDKFLGTHPANADRLETVRQTVSRL